MTISIGDQIPDASLGKIREFGPETVLLSSYTKGKRVALFGLPGAFTATCTASHVPGFIQNMESYRNKGIDHVICLSVNDVFVMKAWDESLGASDAGIEMLSDVSAEFTKAAGLSFSVPALGFTDRCLRFSAYVVDNEIFAFNSETERGVCDLTSGESLLEQIV